MAKVFSSVESARCELCGEVDGCNITDRDTLVFAVRKWARGEKGAWFGFGSIHFHDLAAARRYYDAFVAEQETGPGIRIDLIRVEPRRLLARVGGAANIAFAEGEVQS